MQRIAESKPSKALTTALKKLEQTGFNPTILSCNTYMENHIEKIDLEKIKNIITELSLHDPNIRKRVAILPNVYPKHTEFTEKIQTLNTPELAATLKRLSFIAQPKIYLFWSSNKRVKAYPAENTQKQPLKTRSLSN